jgi:hypothetical protein
VQVEPVWSKCVDWREEQVRADAGVLVETRDDHVLLVDASGSETEIHESVAPGVSVRLLVQGRGFAELDSGDDFIDIFDDAGNWVVRHELAEPPPVEPPPWWVMCSYVLLPEVGWAVYVEGWGGEIPTCQARVRLLAPDGTEVLRLTEADPGWFTPLSGNALGVYGTAVSQQYTSDTSLLLGLDGSEIWRLVSDGEAHGSYMSVAWSTDDVAQRIAGETWHMRNGALLGSIPFASSLNMAPGGRYMTGHSDPPGDDEIALTEDGVLLWQEVVEGEVSGATRASDAGEVLVGLRSGDDENVVLLDRAGRVAWEEPAAGSNIWRLAWYPGGDAFLVVDLDVYLKRYTVWRIAR